MDPLVCTLAVYLFIYFIVCIFTNWFIRDALLFQQIISGQRLLGNNPKLQRNQQSSQSNTTQAAVQIHLLIFKELQDANALCESFDFDQLCWPHQSLDSELLGDLFFLHLWFLCALGGWIHVALCVCGFQRNPILDNGDSNWNLFCHCNSDLRNLSSLP